MLTFALFMSARMGIYQEVIYSKYGKHAKEALYYSHCLPLAGFLLLYKGKARNKKLKNKIYKLGIKIYFNKNQPTKFIVNSVLLFYRYIWSSAHCTGFGSHSVALPSYDIHSKANVIPHWQYINSVYLYFGCIYPYNRMC